MGNKKFYRNKDVFYKLYDGTHFDENEDKCVIGYKNSDETLIKDIVTGQVVESTDSHHIYRLGTYASSFSAFTEVYKCLSGDGRHGTVMDNLRAIRIEKLARKEILSKNDVEYIKNVINKNLVRNHSKEQEKLAEAVKTRSKVDKFAISKEEREF